MHIRHSIPLSDMTKINEYICNRSVKSHGFSGVQIDYNCQRDLYCKPQQLTNPVFANQAVQFLVHETVFEIEAGWFPKCSIRNSLILQGFYYEETFCLAFLLIDKCTIIPNRAPEKHSVLLFR